MKQSFWPIVRSLNWPRILRSSLPLFLLFYLVFWQLDCWPEWKRLFSGAAPPFAAWLQKLWRPDRLVWLLLLAVVLEFRDAYRNKQQQGG